MLIKPHLLEYVRRYSLFSPQNVHSLAANVGVGAAIFVGLLLFMGGGVTKVSRELLGLSPTNNVQLTKMAVGTHMSADELGEGGLQIWSQIFFFFQVPVRKKLKKKKKSLHGLDQERATSALQLW